MTSVLRCTVRSCGGALAKEPKRWVCGSGHSFDIARAGYVNLLQPQDKKALTPGDSAELVAARRRLFDAGVAAPLTAALGERLRGTGVLLDVGCGEGTHVAALATVPRVGWGVDISVPAIEAAAKRHSSLNWVIANADRGLPFLDASVDAVVSITGRRDAAEMARVLKPQAGLAIIAVPAEDDLAELREAVQGAAHSEDRLEKIRGEMAPHFDEASSHVISHRVVLAPERLLDVLATTYRGGRTREQERASGLSAMAVTFAWAVGVFRRRSAS